MNLTTDPWIPVVWRDGRASEVSLHDAFLKGEEIVDLMVRPPERIALMRLLLCITHAALKGPCDIEDWKNCRSRIPEASASYLKKWKHAFELFGEGPRFLQVEKSELKSSREDGKGNPVDKLDLSLASGNNSTLFDNEGGSERHFTPAQLALMLLTFQSFATCGLIGIAEWNGKPTKGSAQAAVCIAGSPLHAFVHKDTLLQTIHVNLITKEIFQERAGRDALWGQPIWEEMPTGPDDPAESTRTYLGRLVPLARAIRLNDDYRTAIIAEGLRYPKFDEVYAEPTATVVTDRKKGRRMLLQADPNKAIWRQLVAITTLRRAEDSIGGPLALSNIGNEETFDFWIGGLAAKKAKLVDSIESLFHKVPSALVGGGRSGSL